MANKRMFSNVLVSSAKFLMLPPTARLLYYELGMAADDEGVVEAFIVLRATLAKEEDLELLSQKGYITILNDELVTFINDWKINNTIKSDRFRESIYHDLIPEYGAGASTEPAWNRVGSKMEPQNSIDKKSIDKNSKDINLGLEQNSLDDLKESNRIAQSNGDSFSFECFWRAYPKKQGREDAETEFNNIHDVDLGTILKAISKWKDSDEWRRESGRFIPKPAKWLAERRWMDEPHIDVEPLLTNPFEEIARGISGGDVRLGNDDGKEISS